MGISIYCIVHICPVTRFDLQNFKTFGAGKQVYSDQNSGYYGIKLLGEPYDIYIAIVYKISKLNLN